MVKLLGMKRLLAFVSEGDAEAYDANFAQTLLKKSDTLLHMLALKGEDAALTTLLDFGAKLDVRLEGGGTPVHTAACGGHHRTLLLLLERRAKVDAAYSCCNNTQPIHMAAGRGHSAVLSILLRHGAGIEVPCGRFYTQSIHVAAYRGHCAAVRTLLGFNASVHAGDKDGGQPMHWAAAGGRCKVLSFLLRQGARVDAEATDNMQPLHSAAAAGHREALELLLESRAAVDAVGGFSGTQPIHAAASSGRPAAIAVLLEHRAAVDAQRRDGQQPIHNAALAGACDVLRQLLGLGVPVDARRRDGGQPIHDAASRGHSEAVCLLLDRAASVNAKLGRGEQPIHMAVFFNHHDVVELLMERRGMVQKMGLFGAEHIHFAALVGHCGWLVELLERRARVDIQDEAGAQPIHWASTLGHCSALGLLMHYRARVDVSTHPDGRQPIHTAAVRGHFHAAGLMLRAGARADAPMAQGIQPVHIAAGYGHCELLGLLAHARASLDAQTRDHEQPVHWAANSNHTNVLRFLLAHRCDVRAERDCVPFRHFQPIHAAAVHGHTEVVSLLLEEGASVDAGLDVWEEQAWHRSVQPVHNAAYFGHCQVLLLLLERRASASAQSERGQPIHSAAAAGHLEVLRLLLQRKAALTARDSLGSQAIHVAASTGHTGVLMELLERDANLIATRDDGLEPIHLAAAGDHTGVLSALLEHGAKSTGWSDSADTNAGQKCKLVLQQVRFLEDLHTKTSKEQESIGNEAFHADILGMVVRGYSQLSLPRLAAQAAADASACELRLCRFEQCVRSCEMALTVQPALPSAKTVAQTLRSAIEALSKDVPSDGAPVEALDKASLLCKFIRLKEAIRDEDQQQEATESEAEAKRPERDDANSSPAALSGTINIETGKVDVIPMGQYCFTASFLRDRGWRRQAFPLDWSAATFRVWRHMLADNFTTLLREKVPGTKHPYNLLFFPDSAMFGHSGGWADKNVRRRVARLQGVLQQRRAVGLAIYFDGMHACSQSLEDLVEDACSLADFELGFQHIIIVWLESTHRHSRAPVWSKASDRVTVLEYTPRQTIQYWDRPEDFPDDVERIASLLMAAFPQVFGRAPRSDGGERSGSEASSEQDVREHWNDPFDETPYWEDYERRFLEDMEARIARKPISTPSIPRANSMIEESREIGRSQWIVLGGQDPRGIIVRSGEALSSKVYEVRLSTSSLVEELELSGNRLHYKKVSGDGPDFGWVSIEHDGKKLLQRKDAAVGGDEREETESTVLAGQALPERKTEAPGKEARTQRSVTEREAVREEPVLKREQQHAPPQQVHTQPERPMLRQQPQGQRRQQRQQRQPQQPRVSQRQQQQQQVPRQGEQQEHQEVQKEAQEQSQTIGVAAAADAAAADAAAAAAAAAPAAAAAAAAPPKRSKEPASSIEGGLKKSVAGQTAAQPVRGEEEPLPKDRRALVELIVESRTVVHFQEMEEGQQLWVVVKARQSGGLVVRSGESLQSRQLNSSLAVGAVIQELEVADNRLHYRRIRGDGPDFGWVNIQSNGLRLLERLSLREWRAASAELLERRRRAWTAGP